MAVRLAASVFGILGTLALLPEGGGGGGGEGGGDGEKGFTPITSQEALDRIVSERLKRKETSLRKTITDEVTADLAEKARIAKATEDNDLAEQLRISEEKRVKAEEDAKTERVQRLKDTAAIKHKLPDDLAELLKGDTEEEITAHAERLAKVVKVDGKGGDESNGENKGGNGDGSEGGNTNGGGESGSNNGDNDAGAIGSRNKSNNGSVPAFKINPRHKITPLG